MSKEIVYQGFTPFSFQKAVIEELIGARGSGKIAVAKSMRQRGKSTLIINILLYYAINFSGTKNFCVSPTLKQAKEIYKSMVSAIKQSGVIESSNGTELVVNLINGSSINLKSAQQGEALRGYTCTGILCIDECAYIPDEVYNIIRPWTDFHKAVTLMVSTPFTKSGFFWDYFNYGLEKLHNTVTIDWCDEKYIPDMERIMPPDRLEEYRLTLPKNAFRTEYLGEWLDDEGVVFNHFKECIRKNEIKPTDKLYVGIDWSNQGENDDTVISMVNQYGQQVYLRYFNNLSPTKQINIISKELEPYERQIVRICPELNSIGTPYTDMLKERLQIGTQNKIEGFNTSNKSKADLVAKLQVAFEQNEIEILDDDKQTRQLGYYTAEYNPVTKNVSYNAPNGLHDDICIALMLSWHAFKENTHMGNYQLQLRHRRI